MDFVAPSTYVEALKLIDRGTHACCIPVIRNDEVTVATVAYTVTGRPAEWLCSGTYAEQMKALVLGAVFAYRELAR